MGAFSLCIIMYIIDLITRAHDLRLNCHVYAQLQKQCHFFGFLRTSSCWYICMGRNQSFSIAPKMTGIEDTYQTLTAISFQVGVNKSSKIFVIINIREMICRVSVPVGSIIPWFVYRYYLEMFHLV